MKTKLITPPTTLAVTLDEAKAYYRVIGSMEDDVIRETIDTASAKAAQITNRQFGVATYEGYLDAFQSSVEIPLPPLVGVDAISYTAADGTDKPYTAFTVDDAIEPAILYFDETIPDLKQSGVNNIKVTFRCGYTETPSPIKSYIKVVGQTLFEQRHMGEKEGGIVDTSRAHYHHLLDSYRIIPV